MKLARISHGAGPLLLLTVVALGCVTGCSKERGAKSPARILSPVEGALALSTDRQAGPGAVTQDGSPPPGLVTVSFGGDEITFWPYTGSSFDGTPSDPVNLVFAGNADPVTIRAALLSLNGDRTDFGFPDDYPFNARWSDAIGDVQTNYSGAEGWQGSVVQLQLGEYAPLRVHLRLWRTGEKFGSDGTWTLGAAHFEVMIPGTADHQVLSWEIAQQVVYVDLYRSGLLDPATPFALSGVINATPSFRDIPDAIYNGLPEVLKAAIGGPPGSVSSPIPIPNDGQATIFHLTGNPPAATGEFASSYAFTYDQVIPKPLCSDGPLDWVNVSGPVTLERSTTVDATGRYEYHSRISGQLTVTPVDVTQSPPVPSGEPFKANVADVQQGAIDPAVAWALAESRRMAPQRGGSEMLLTRLRVSSAGQDSYRAQEWCLGPQP